jgi:hypothetical protein
MQAPFPPAAAIGEISLHAGRVAARFGRVRAGCCVLDWAHVPLLSPWPELATRPLVQPHVCHGRARR